MTEDTTHTAAFEAVRRRLFGLAYRMTASAADAEDIVQDAYVRWHEAGEEGIDNAAEPEGQPELP